MSEAQRFIDVLRNEFNAAMMDVENISRFGIPDSDNKHRIEITFKGSHRNPGVTDFVEDVAEEFSGGLTYDIVSVRRQTNSEYVIILKIHS